MVRSRSVGVGRIGRVIMRGGNAPSGEFCGWIEARKGVRLLPALLFALTSAAFSSLSPLLLYDV